MKNTNKTHRKILAEAVENARRIYGSYKPIREAIGCKQSNWTCIKAYGFVGHSVYLRDLISFLMGLHLLPASYTLDSDPPVPISDDCAGTDRQETQSNTNSDKNSWYIAGSIAEIVVILQNIQTLLEASAVPISRRLERAEADVTCVLDGIRTMREMLRLG